MGLIDELLPQALVLASKIATARKITLDLAKTNPYHETTEGRIYCTLCNAYRDSAANADELEHHPTCVYRRAQEFRDALAT